MFNHPFIQKSNFHSFTACPSFDMDEKLNSWREGDLKTIFMTDSFIEITSTLPYNIEKDREWTSQHKEPYVWTNIASDATLSISTSIGWSNQFSRPKELSFMYFIDDNCYFYFFWTQKSIKLILALYGVQFMTISVSWKWYLDIMV